MDKIITKEKKGMLALWTAKFVSFHLMCPIRRNHAVHQFHYVIARYQLVIPLRYEHGKTLNDNGKWSAFLLAEKLQFHATRPAFWSEEWQSDCTRYSATAKFSDAATPHRCFTGKREAGKPRRTLPAGLAFSSSRFTRFAAATTPAFPSAPVEALLPALGARGTHSQRWPHHHLPQALCAGGRDRNSTESAEAVHQSGNSSMQSQQPPGRTQQNVLSGRIVSKWVLCSSRVPQLIVPFLPCGQPVSPQHPGYPPEQIP